MVVTRRVVSLTSHFCLGADHGMRNYEVLSRSSATLVSFRSKSYVLSCLHVVFPFLYPHYYQQDWLKQIQRHHIKCSLDIRSSITGEIEQTVMVEPDSVLEHPSR